MQPCVELAWSLNADLHADLHADLTMRRAAVHAALHAAFTMLHAALRGACMDVTLWKAVIDKHHVDRLHSACMRRACSLAWRLHRQTVHSHWAVSDPGPARARCATLRRCVTLRDAV
eukprot:352818-Chlamydomonas_euryale.AAC.1